MFPNPTTANDSTTAEQLALELEKGFADFRELTQKLQLSAEELDLLLDEDETRDTLRIRAKLVAYQLKLISLRYAPHAFSKIVQLTESEKPEVARRACTAVLRIAGIAPDQLERKEVRADKKEEKQQEKEARFPCRPPEHQNPEQRKKLIENLLILYRAFPKDPDAQPESDTPPYDPFRTDRLSPNPAAPTAPPITPAPIVPPNVSRNANDRNSI